ncbi:MAG TPA: ligase-associated DNA damage response exonuclease [Steroidobacteraceae bacterium]
MGPEELVQVTPRGLYCAAGDFYIDPWQPVARAVITHAHGDHLRGGSREYYLAAAGAGLARLRLPTDASLHRLEYGQQVSLGDTDVSLHPAGHILGSSQIRVERRGHVWVVSGDYKRDPDPTCAPFETLPCDVFISEATFALPAYRWTDTRTVAREILAWWQENRSRGLASVLFAYALGKAQRVLAELAPLTNDSVFVHGAVAGLTEVYRAQGIPMLNTLPATVASAVNYAGALILAPPSAAGSPWMRRFGNHRTGFCSGWMRIRGDRRRRGYDRGFVLSDHADWPSLLQTCHESGAKRILLTHGFTDALCRYLREQGVDAAALRTEYGAEE